MSDATTETKAPEVTTPKEPLTGKDAIYAKIADAVQERTGKKVGKTGGQAIMNLVVGEIFAEAVKSGVFRFNGGMGSLHVRKYQAGSRRLPSGQATTFGERSKLRYEEGVAVRTLIEGGNGAAVPAVATAGVVDLS